MSKNDRTICEGCKSLKSKHLGIYKCGTVPFKKDNKQCPCLICLIKSMCTIACQEFKDY